jgi:hypothetical protein
MTDISPCVQADSAFDGPGRMNNASLAELLALEADQSSGYLKRAFDRASRLAFVWPEEASTMLAQNRSLTELPGVGP